MKKPGIIERLKTKKITKEYYKKHPFFVGGGVSKKTGEPCVKMGIHGNGAIKFECWEDVHDVVKSIVGFYSEMCEREGIKTRSGVKLSAPVIGSDIDYDWEKYDIVIYPPSIGVIRLNGRDGVEDFIRQIRDECTAIEDYCEKCKNDIEAKHHR